MSRTASIQPVNSIIFIHGGGSFNIPADEIDRRKSLVAASDDCLVVCVHPEIDGPTDLIIGRGVDIAPDRLPDWAGRLSTLTRRVIIDQVDEHIIHDQIVSSHAPTICLWFSHPRWPERVLIGID
jgi:hypothetical protein